MGTRSKVSIYKIETVEDKPTRNHLVSVYQQFDGGLEWVGSRVADFLAKGKLGNGIQVDERLLGTFFNGAGDLAAQFIHKFKDRIGGLYICDKEDEEEYNYDILIYDDFGKNPHAMIGYGGEEYDEDTDDYIDIEYHEYTPEEFQEFIENPLKKDIEEA